MPAVQPLSEYFVALGPVIGQLASMIGGALGAALQVIVPAMTLWWKLVAALLPVFTGLLQMLQPFTTAIGALAGAVLVAYGAFKVFRMVSTIISVVRTAWTLLSLAFTASPIGMIITAIAALAAGLYLFFTKTETGRALWDKIWGAIKATWDVVWGALKVGFEKLGEIAKWLWENALQPAFSAIGKAIGWVKDHWEIFAAVLGGPIGILVALQSKFGVVSTVIQALGTVITWLWQNIIQPAFSFIGTIIGGVWEVVKFIFNAWMTIFRAVGSVVMWLWNNVVTPAFNAIKTIITTWWGGVQIVFGFFRDILVTVGGWVWDMVGRVVGFFTNLAEGIRDKATLAKDWVVEKFNLVIDFFRGLPATMRDLAGKIWDPIKNAAKAVFNSIARLWNNTVGKVNFTVPDWIPGVGGKKFSMPQIPTFAYGGRVRGAGTATSDSILSWLSNGEFVSPAHAVNARTLPLLEAMRSGWTPPAWLTGAALGGGLPGFAGGGRVPYGLPVGSSGPVTEPWVQELEKRFGVKASTYAGHQEKDGKNKGIDWVGSVDAMQRFAEFLRDNKSQVEQVIWMNPNTGEKIGVADGEMVGPGTSQPGYYSADWAGHQDHVHTRQSFSIGSSQNPAGPGIDSTPGAGSLSVGGSAGAPIGSGLSSSGGSSSSPSWGNSGGESRFNSAEEADKGGVIPVWVENWPATLGGGGGGAGAPTSLGDGDPSAVPTGGAPAASAVDTIPLKKNPDGTYSSTDPEWDRLIKRESGGRADRKQEVIDANSGGNEASGLFQIAKGTWKGYGGTKFAPTAGEATPEQQAEIAARIFNKEGGKPWGSGLSGRESDEKLRAGIQRKSAPAPAPAPDPTATPTDVSPVTPSDTPTLAPSEDPGNGYNVGESGGDDTKKRDPQEFTIGGGALSAQLGGLVKTALHNGIDDFIAANPGLLGNYDNTEGTSLGDRAGGVASTAISGQFGSALGIFGMDIQPPILDAVGTYMQDNPRDKGENGTATKKDLVDLVEAFLRGGPMQVIVNNPQDGDDVVRKVDQDRRRRMRRYVKS
ncbi:transglycosylase family protein [Gordonia rubripertincta]|nr:transglycosylase family protein [Gordonia rubripertincta]